jgi:hypothetical protein
MHPERYPNNITVVVLHITTIKYSPVPFSRLEGRVVFDNHEIGPLVGNEAKSCKFCRVFVNDLPYSVKIR